MSGMQLRTEIPVSAAVPVSATLTPMTNHLAAGPGVTAFKRGALGFGCWRSIPSNIHCSNSAASGCLLLLLVAERKPRPESKLWPSPRWLTPPCPWSARSSCHILAQLLWSWSMYALGCKCSHPGCSGMVSSKNKCGESLYVSNEKCTTLDLVPKNTRLWKVSFSRLDSATGKYPILSIQRRRGTAPGPLLLPSHAAGNFQAAAITLSLHGRRFS